MQGLQGVRNLRELFTNKYQQGDTTQRSPFENNFFHQYQRQTQVNWKYKQGQQPFHVANSRDGSTERNNQPKLPVFQNRDHQSPDLQQRSQLKKFSITNQGFYKKQQLDDFLQKSSLIQSDHEQKLLQQSGIKPNKVMNVPSSNNNSVLAIESRRNSQDPSQLAKESKDDIRRNRHAEKQQYLELSHIIDDKHPPNTNVRSSQEREGSQSKRQNSVRQLNINRNQFHFHFVIGKGGFGKVWKVEAKKSKNYYAMKEMSKAKILSKKSVNSVMNERVLLQTIKHPFLVNMIHAFQDRDNLYLIMDLLTGGDLRFHIGRLHRFKEHQTKFFIACMFLALEHLHNNSIIHRDIKPENLVLDAKGYLRVTDLGIARVLRPENSQDTSGTPGYMAPEVMCRQNHGIAVDYYAVGVIGYEFMLGRRPYVGRSRREIRDQILAKQVQIKRSEIPDGWTIEAADFINRLIQRKPQSRLGFNGPQEVKSHPWLKTYPWDLLYSKQLEAPFIPKTIDDNYDYQQQISADNDSQDELIQQNVQLLRRNSVQNLFNGYGAESPQPTTKSTSNTSSNQNTCANTNPDRSSH